MTSFRLFHFPVRSFLQVVLPINKPASRSRALPRGVEQWARHHCPLGLWDQQGLSDFPRWIVIVCLQCYVQINGHHLQGDKYCAPWFCRVLQSAPVLLCLGQMPGELWAQRGSLLRSWLETLFFVIFDPRKTVEGSPQFPRGSTEGRQIWT